MFAQNNEFCKIHSQKQMPKQTSVKMKILPISMQCYLVFKGLKNKTSLKR
jgi:hypothetical protein